MAVGHARTHTFTVEEYHRMGEAGVLPPDGRFELVEGEVVEMTPIGSRHAAVVNQLNALLVRAAGDEAIVSVQNPIRLSAYDEPEPDLALLRLRPDHFCESLPGPEDVLLVIEVADSSLSYDRETKLSLYARSGIPEAWVVDLANNGIEVHTDPGGSVYRQRQLATVGETVPLHALKAQPMEVATALLASV